MTNQLPDRSASPPPDAPVHVEGRIASFLTAVKGLTISNVLVIGMLVIIAIPAYTVWRALGDQALLDRFLSVYEEKYSQNFSCALRHVQARGGPAQWALSTGFAFRGADRWTVSVWLGHEPSNEEVLSYCQSLELIADKLADADDDRDRDASVDQPGE